eukprot:CAMPEP_0206800124 /NCGR_PEP_ID=MMETSP0975-20121206/1534_1 /ASSEMBLY_ACC=CAM_ASM_000399 /TAXON_ID=483370 /ORGANISM="non described non described, Strain CCMP2097" /LENGTH=117 /DNA_ID=CAMNT_0054342113 /DNA_START=389 /DNA_END=742 /DNA_ORIENTATION=+
MQLPHTVPVARALADVAKGEAACRRHKVVVARLAVGALPQNHQILLAQSSRSLERRHGGVSTWRRHGGVGRVTRRERGGEALREVRLHQVVDFLLRVQRVSVDEDAAPPRAVEELLF